MTSAPARLRRSDHISWFAHMGAVYLFHDLYGYLMEMSPDIADLIEAFAGGAQTEHTIAAYRGDGDARQFVDVLVAHAVLVEPDDDERDAIWPFVPIKGKWNVWQRHGERLVLWTAWGTRPITQLMLDPEETAMWDAFDGEKRLNELRMRFPADKLRALVHRLTHSDVQALKLSMMPWSTYAKRPGIAPRYLASTMPYASWRPGEPVPHAVDLVGYHRELVDAEAQFEHQETTLSHLLRIAHPALAGRSYGEALVDAVIARGLPTGRVRVLEIGGGLGYVAQAAIARLRASGREVDYTIVELSPALAEAQRSRAEATWVAGDVLDARIDGTFELVLANEMVGDLPAKQLSRSDLGLALDGTGEVDPAKLRAIAPLAAELGIHLDDAPEPFYLQTGAIELVAKIARWLAPGGIAVVTEFGDVAKYPTLSTHLDHPELSTHFGHLLQAARSAGLDANVEFVIDLLDVDRTHTGLATTRSHFRALRALVADAGVELAKIGYTPELLAHAIGGALDVATIGELRWDRIEDRLMGLVPHEFKALIAKRAR
jgi:SAM-dependent methyltransferase